jgi:hypothetical protein
MKVQRAFLRWVIRVLVYALLGFITTWLVAAGLVFQKVPVPLPVLSPVQWVALDTPGEFATVRSYSFFGTEGKVANYNSLSSADSWGPNLSILDMTIGECSFSASSIGNPRGWSVIERSTWQAVVDAEVIVEEARGWPLVSFRAWARKNGSGWDTHGGISLAPSGSGHGNRLVDWRALPLIPVWEGAAAGLALFGMIWAVAVRCLSYIVRRLRDLGRMRRQGQAAGQPIRLVWIFAPMDRYRILMGLILCGVLALLTTFVVAVIAELQQDLAPPRTFAYAVVIEHNGTGFLQSTYRDWGLGYENRYTFIEEDHFRDGFRASWHGVAQAMQYNAPNPPERRPWGFQPYPPIPESMDKWPSYIESARGWPALSFWSYRYTSNSKTTHRGSIDITALTTAIGQSTQAGPPVYKGAAYYPIWSGLAINLVFYSAIWAVPLFEIIALTSYGRLWRWGCPKCGYDLKGDFQSGCPECGWGMPAEDAAVGRD